MSIHQASGYSSCNRCNLTTASRRSMIDPFITASSFHHSPPPPQPTLFNLDRLWRQARPRAKSSEERNARALYVQIYMNSFSAGLAAKAAYARAPRASEAGLSHTTGADASVRHHRAERGMDRYRAGVAAVHRMPRGAIPHARSSAGPPAHQPASPRAVLEGDRRGASPTGLNFFKISVSRKFTFDQCNNVTKFLGYSQTP